MYSRILLATDGSEAADPATEHAIDLAAREAATLHVLYVVDPAMLPLESTGVDLLSLLEEAAHEAVETVEGRAEDAGVTDVETAVERGVAHREITRYAEAHDCDVVVVGTHGRTGLDRMLLGSVAGRVVRTASVPVLVVPSGG